MSPLLLLACTSPPGSGVVSLHDTTTEMLVALGRQDRLLAVTEPSFLSPAAEAAVADIPRLPGGAIAAETLLAMHPALVLGTDVVAERQPELPPALERGGVEVLFIDPEGLAGLWRALGDVGAAVDAAPEAAALSKRLRSSLPPLPSREDPLRVFFYDCCDPPFTAGGRAPVSELLHYLGAVNIFEDIDQDWTTVSWEAAAGRSPELIVVHDYDWSGQAGAAEKRAAVAANAWLADTPAVTAGQITSMPLALALEGLRSLEALTSLAPHVAAAREHRRTAPKPGAHPVRNP